MKKLKYLVKINPSKSEIKNKKINCTFAPMERIHNGFVDTEEIKQIKAVYGGYTYFRENDIVIAKVTPCYENGDIAIAKKLVNGIGFGTTEINVFRVRKYSTDFIYYSLQENHIMKYGESHMVGAAGLKRVPTDYYYSLKIPVPNIKKQILLSSFLNKKLNNLNIIIHKNKTYIEKLKEAKQSLISEAVTGKIDLRDWDIIETGEQI